MPRPHLDDLSPGLTPPGELTFCSEAAVAFGPASLSNLGPGFDALGLALSGLGDAVEAWRVEEPGMHVLPSETPGAPPIPLEAARNTAAVAAARVLRMLGARQGLALRIRKGIPIGSGIGGSAASAVAGAWAANLLFGHPLEKEALVEAVLAGEEVASGSRHGDNVLPALFGGLVLVSPAAPRTYRRLTLPAPLHVALIVPNVPILTKDARRALPAQVPRQDATQNAAALAFMIHAFACGDYAAVGRHMMADRLVEPVRARSVPCYEAVRRAALEAGAWGCALTGSGPALFALAPSAAHAEDVAKAMLKASRAAGIEAMGLATQADYEGVRRGDY